MPTIWDPNLSELAQACADAGHRPTDPADPGDVYRCAVAALEEARDHMETAVSQADHDEAIAEVEQERKEAEDEAKEATKERDEANKRIEELEGDLLAAQQDLKAAREVLGATDSSAARLEMWLLEQARAELLDRVADLAVAGAERILKREVDAKAHAEMLVALKQEL